MVGLVRSANTPIIVLILVPLAASAGAANATVVFVLVVPPVASLTGAAMNTLDFYAT